MADGRLLIVAPDIDLRRSLEFLLESEGYRVVSHPSISAVPRSMAVDCTILDHRAIVGPEIQVLAFCRKVGPVILLKGSQWPSLAAYVSRVVHKPLLGKPLLLAVEETLGIVRRDAGNPK